LSWTCIALCKAGCICIEGYLRDEKGRCVLASECNKECTKECPPHEVYSDCGANSCQMFCDWYYNPDSYACRPICTPGCICEEGYIRGPNGDCIMPTECPNAEVYGANRQYEECGANKHYEECGTACPKTCRDIRENIANLCIDLCVAGCFCDSGYVLGDNGECVSETECGPQLVDV
jgi:hypothetical protein